MEDYYQVAPRYGTNQDLVDLFEEAHKRNMHVLLDLVPGHTSITHAWFKESAQPKKHAYTDRYIWTNSVKKMMDDVDGIASVLRGFWQREGCCGVNCFSSQPALNYGFANITDNSWQQPVDAPGPVATNVVLNPFDRVVTAKDMGIDQMKKLICWGEKIRKTAEGTIEIAPKSMVWLIEE